MIPLNPIDIFKSQSMREWLSTQDNIDGALAQYRSGISLLLRKIECLQYLILHRLDWEEGRALDAKTSYAIHAGSEIEQRNNSKINKHFFRLLKNKVNELKRIIYIGSLADKKISNEITYLEQHLFKKIANDPALSSSLGGAQQFHTHAKEIETMLHEEEKTVDTIERSFNDVYRIAYTDDRNKIREILPALDRSLETFKEKVRRETQLFTGLVLTDTVSNWHVELERHLQDTPFLNGFTDLQQNSQKMLALLRERTMKLYHAQFRSRLRDVIPLSEREHQRGFYACTERKEFSIAVLQAIDSGNSNADTVVWELSLPESLFERFFHEDPHSADNQFHLTEEAYEHAFYIPVSRFNDFNRYAHVGVITAKLL